VKNTYTELKAEEHRTTISDRKVEVKANDHLTVNQDQHIKLGTAQLTSVGKEIHLKAGDKMVIEAGSELTLKAGGSFIKLDGGGITVVGPVVKINAGGSAGTGSGIAILMPLLPIPAPSAKAGNLMAPAQPGQRLPVPPVEPTKLSFDIRLADRPGEGAFALANTPWRIIRMSEPSWKKSVVFQKAM